ncbi:hypothetical protein D9M68_469060 [compost metagenome]
MVPGGMDEIMVESGMDDGVCRRCGFAQHIKVVERALDYIGAGGDKMFCFLHGAGKAGDAVACA